MGCFKTADNVHDEKSFREFLRALMQDRVKADANPDSYSPYGANGQGWENDTITDFLESAIAWAEASEEGTEYYSIPAKGSAYPLRGEGV